MTSWFKYPGLNGKRSRKSTFLTFYLWECEIHHYHSILGRYSSWVSSSARVGLWCLVGVEKFRAVRLLFQYTVWWWTSHIFASPLLKPRLRISITLTKFKRPWSPAIGNYGRTGNNALHPTQQGEGQSYRGGDCPRFCDWSHCSDRYDFLDVCYHLALRILTEFENFFFGFKRIRMEICWPTWLQNHPHRDSEEYSCKHSRSQLDPVLVGPPGLVRRRNRVVELANFRACF